MRFLAFDKLSCLIFVFSTFLFLSCKKDKNVVEEKPVVPGITATRAELTKDSIFLYAKEVYLWNDALPTYEQFNPRSYKSSADEYTNFSLELFRITQFKTDPSTNRPYEVPDAGSPNDPKYSYIEDLIASGKITYKRNDQSFVELDGQGDDVGIGIAGFVTKRTANNQVENSEVRIRFISPGSPAEKAGLKRGDNITKLNGRTFQNPYNQADVDFINNVFDNATISIEGIKAKTGLPYTLSLSKTKYTSSPIYKDSIYTVNSKKIGYLAYARFSNSDNSSAVLNTVFSKFSAAGVTSLVIDLRYNGGGFVSTAQLLTNLIAPSRLTGQRMFSETYNTLMQSNGATILRNQPRRDQSGKIQFSNGRVITQFQDDYSIASNSFNFSKTGSLNNIEKVVFLVGGGTASASELVINNLKPHIDVKLIGNLTYGKPVGFFPIRIDKYDVYYSMFETLNSASEGKYYAGFTPNLIIPDDVSKDFGDITELRLAAAIRYIDNNTLTVSSTNANTTIMSAKGVRTAATILKVEDITNNNGFVGMVEDRRNRKK